MFRRRDPLSNKGHCQYEPIKYELLPVLVFLGACFFFELCDKTVDAIRQKRSLEPPPGLLILFCSELPVKTNTLLLRTLFSLSRWRIIDTSPHSRPAAGHFTQTERRQLAKPTEVVHQRAPQQFDHGVECSLSPVTDSRGDKRRQFRQRIYRERTSSGVFSCREVTCFDEQTCTFTNITDDA